MGQHCQSRIPVVRRDPAPCLGEYRNRTCRRLHGVGNRVMHARIRRGEIRV